MTIKGLLRFVVLTVVRPGAGLQGDDLVAPQGLEERLEAAVDPTAHHLTVDLDGADAGRPLDLPHRRGTDETHFDPLGRMFRVHSRKSTEHVERCHPWNHGAGTESSRLRELGWQYGRCVPSATHRPGNLPAEATSFVGRRSELAELRKKLARARLVSLIGPGG